MMYNEVVFLFFFSSRRRHTRFDCNWSSDVCSSDLKRTADRGPRIADCGPRIADSGSERSEGLDVELLGFFGAVHDEAETRSEERRVGKECRTRWSPDH